MEKHAGKRAAKRLGKKEKPGRRGKTGLTMLFFRYLLTTGIAILACFLVWWNIFLILLRQGRVLPASTAADGASQVIAELEDGLEPDEIPYWYRWARFSTSGERLDESKMTRSQRNAMARALAGDSYPTGFPYGQYHRFARLPDGSLCVLQYDYSVPYGSAWAQAHLPDFQITALFMLVAPLILIILFTTRRYARILKRDAALVTSATQAIADRRLDVPFEGGASVRELSAALDTMEMLRSSLADALASQWTMQQQREREISALTHDLKTPLTIIQGNAELLAEQECTPVQEIQAILRSTQHMWNYIDRLGVLSRQMHTAGKERECMPLFALFEEWKSTGEGLCAPRGIHFKAARPPEATCCVEKDAVCRAVANVLDNAARFAPQGGHIALDVSVRENVLMITVCDDGPGFGAEALTHAGRLFYTHETERPQGGHSGLGLAYAKGVTQEYGGELTAENGPCGACVRLTLACVCA